MSQLYELTSTLQTKLEKNHKSNHQLIVEVFSDTVGCTDGWNDEDIVEFLTPSLGISSEADTEILAQLKSWGIIYPYPSN